MTHMVSVVDSDSLAWVFLAKRTDCFNCWNVLTLYFKVLMLLKIKYRLLDTNYTIRLTASIRHIRNGGSHCLSRRRR